MKTMLVGIDISKDVFDYCILDEDHNILSSKNVSSNTEEGIEEFCNHINEFKGYKSWICMEHTGRYGALLCTEFAKRKLTFSLLNPLEIKLSIGMIRGKNDSIDAYRIASYGICNKHKLVPFKLASKKIQKLKAIISVRSFLVKINVQYKNMIKSLRLLDKSVSLEDEIKKLERQLKIKNKEIKAVDKSLDLIIKSDEALKSTYTKITQVIGVGPITAIKCITETENFTKFINGRKFSCHCGLAPFEHSSGSSVRGRTKTSKLRNKELKAILFQAASSAIQHDPQLKAYFARKVEEGKMKLSVLNAVANKLVLRIFAVALRDEPYVKNMC